MAVLPERDLGVVILWNSDSSLPGGLLPTILDRAIGMPAQRWIDLPNASELMMAEASDTDATPEPVNNKAPGVSSGTSVASPK